MKQEFESHPSREKYQKEYEDTLRKRLKDIMTEMETYASREKKLCRKKEAAFILPENLRSQYYHRQEMHAKCLKEAGTKGEEGDVEGANAAMTRALEHKEYVDTVRKSRTWDFPGEVCCKICGHRYVLGAEVKELVGHEGLSGYIWEEEHMSSKVHGAYVRMRDHLAKLSEHRHTVEPEAPRRSRSPRKRSPQRDKTCPAPVQKSSQTIKTGRPAANQKTTVTVTFS